MTRLLCDLKSAFRPLNRGEWTLFLSGANLLLLNFLMVQHCTVAIRQAEFAVIGFSLAYFLGISLGYFVSDRLDAATIRRLLPAFLLTQMALFLALQPLHLVISRPVARWAANHALSPLSGEVAGGLVLCMLLAICTTSLYAIFLPRAISGEALPLRRCYSIEVAGSLLGLALVPPLAAISHEALLGAYFATFLGLAVCVGLRPRIVTFMAAISVAFLLGFGPADRRVAQWCYERIYGWKIVGMPQVTYTPYHKIEVVAGPAAQTRLLLNGRRQFASDPQRTYAYFVAEYPARRLGAPRVALLGCGSMATVGLIGDFVPSIQIVDLDAGVFATARTHFQAFNRLDTLTNWTFSPNDAKHFLANTTERYDLILHDIPPARSRQVALTYTDEFFQLVRARLTAGGMFSISCLTPLADDSAYSRRMLATLASVFERHFVLVHRGSCYFYGGGPAMVEPSAAEALAALPPGRRSGVTVLTRSEIAGLVRGAKIITLSNVGDLIYD